MSRKKNLNRIIKELKGLKLYRGSRIRSRNLNSLIFNDCKSAYSEIYAKHCGYAIGLTVSRLDLADKSLQDCWLDVPNLLQDTLNVVKETCLVSGILGGIEMYQKNKRSSAHGRAFKPHMHLTIFCYNDFLRLPLYLLEVNLRKLKLDYRIERLKSGVDVARWMSYCIKGRNDALLQRITQEALGGGSVFLFYNKALDTQSLEALIESAGIKNVIVDNYPVDIISCRRQRDGGLQAGVFIRAQCLHSGIGLFKGMLCKRQGGAQFTWSEYSSIPEFVNKLSLLEAQAGFLANLQAAGAFNKASGLVSKDSALKVYPRLSFKSHYWEFLNGEVYDGQTGRLLNGFKELDLFISCGKFHKGVFDELPKPINVLRILNEVCAKEDQIQFVYGMATLWHELDWQNLGRKDMPGLYVYGSPNSFKSLFIKTLLKHTFEGILIHSVAQFGEGDSNRFALSLLKGVSVGVIFGDDIKHSSGLLKYAGRFINLLDGESVGYEEKYKDPCTLEYRGGLALTGNSLLSELFPGDSEAISNRLMSIRFAGGTKDLKDAILNLDPLEIAGFVLLCNTLFLKDRLNINGRLPKSWENVSGNANKRFNGLLESVLRLPEMFSFGSGFGGFLPEPAQLEAAGEKKKIKIGRIKRKLLRTKK